MKIFKRWGEPAAYFYVLPAMVPLTLFWLAPMVYVVYLSFTNWDFMSPVKTWVGLENYKELFANEEFYKALKVTLLFGLGMVIPTMVGGLALALILGRPGRGSGVYRAILFSPWVTPTVAISIVWSWIFEPRSGLANSILIGLGIEGLPWLQSSKWALLCVIIVSVWRYVGWAMVFYWVALQGVPKELREAALMDGASGWGVFKSVTLPLISPTSFFLFIILWLQSFQAYDQINILTQGGPSGSTRTLLYMYYQSAFDRYNVGEASAVALVLVFIAALFSLVSVTVTRRSVHYLQ